jgi:predicted dehydrogenase
MYKFGLIGCGRIAPRHAEQIKKIGNLIAVCDTDKAKADAFAKEYNSRPYYSIDDLLQGSKEVDIITVCTPNGYHAEHAIKSLQAGKNVLCEKPLCITSAAAWQMVDTAYFCRKKLFVVKQNRYNPAVKYVKDLLDNNMLGGITSFQINCFWNRPQEYYTGGWKGDIHLDAGILYTQFSHFIDLLFWLLGEVENCTGFKKDHHLRRNFNIEDTGVAILQMKTGALGTINYTINAQPRNIEGSFALFGEKASIKIGGEYLNRVEWYEDNGINKIQSYANDYVFYQGSMSNHHIVYDELIKALSSNASNLSIEAKEAAKTVEIIEEIYKNTTDKS